MKFLNRITLFSSIVTVLLMGSMPVQAWKWLETTPASKFNDDDWSLLKSTARDLLDNGQDGEIREWDNPDTGNSGKIKIISSSDSDGKKCRKTAFKNIASFYSLSGQQVHRLCKQSDGTWKIED